MSLRKIVAMFGQTDLPERAAELLRRYTPRVSQQFPPANGEIGDTKSWAQMLLRPGEFWDLVMLMRPSPTLKLHEPIGGIHSNLLRTPFGQAGIIENIWTDSKVRGLGVGKAAHGLALAKFRGDARSDPDSPYVGTFAEMNHPALMSAQQLKSEVMDPKERLLFWRGEGYLRLDLAYAQPAVELGGQQVEHVILAFRPEQPGQKSVQGPFVRAFLNAYFPSSFTQFWSEKNSHLLDPTVQRVFSAIPDAPIRLLPLV